MICKGPHPTDRLRQAETKAIFSAYPHLLSKHILTDRGDGQNFKLYMLLVAMLGFKAHDLPPLHTLIEKSVHRGYG